MTWRKESPQYTTQAIDGPGPRHGHLSQVEDTSFAHLPMLADEALQKSWGFGTDSTIQDFREAISSSPPRLSAHCLRLKEHLETSYRQIHTRDGYEIQLKIYKKRTAGRNATLAFKMHGGGWVVGTHETEEEENIRVATIPDVIVVSVNYRLAPEFAFPTPLHDCVDALIWCQSNADDLGIDPSTIVLLGCSAGANLAAALAITTRDQGITGIIGQHLAIPVTCHPKFFGQIPEKNKFELLSYQQNYHAPMVDALRMEIFWDLYVGLEPSANTLHSPLLCEDLRNLPPALIQVAGLDPLRDEGISYGEALQKNGVEVTMEVYKGLVHGFASFWELPETEQYYERLLHFIQGLN